MFDRRGDRRSESQLARAGPARNKSAHRGVATERGRNDGSVDNSLQDLIFVSWRILLWLVVPKLVCLSRLINGYQSRPRHSTSSRARWRPTTRMRACSTCVTSSRSCVGSCGTTRKSTCLLRQFVDRICRARTRCPRPFATLTFAPLTSPTLLL